MTRWPLASRHLVIASLNDAPQVQCVALVLGRDGDGFVWRYVAAAPAFAYRQGEHRCRLPDAVAVEAFGVALFLEEDADGAWLTGERVGATRTLNPDHSPREWCDSRWAFTRVPVHPAVAPVLRKIAARATVARAA